MNQQNKLADRIENMAALGVLSNLDGSAEPELNGSLPAEEKSLIVAALRAAGSAEPFGYVSAITMKALQLQAEGHGFIVACAGYDTTIPVYAHPAPASSGAQWRYDIQHGPNGETNYAWVYDQTNVMVCTTQTHLAIAIVRAVNATLSAAPAPEPDEGVRESGRQGIYIASKTRHADRWLTLRAAGAPIISTWIDEAGEGQSADLNNLWQRCISEAATCAVMIVYREPEDTLKGAWVEMGAAMAFGTPVFAVGLRDYTIAKYDRVRHFDTIEEAFKAAISVLGRSSPSPLPQAAEKAAETVEREPTSESIARTICLSYGRDPDELTSRLEMCDEDNQPVPTWRVYEEQAKAVLKNHCSTAAEPTRDRPYGELETVDAVTGQWRKRTKAEVDAIYDKGRREPTREEIAPSTKPQWPGGCHDPDSCARHKSCMYQRCTHEGAWIRGEIDALDLTKPRGGTAAGGE